MSAITAGMVVAYPIENCPGYFVTAEGGVWSERHGRGKYLKASCNHHGYPRVTLLNSEGRSSYQVHRLVLEAFMGPRPGGMGCRHLDGNKLNNDLSNICWGTAKENAADRFRHGTSGAKLTATDVLQIRRIYGWKTYTRKAIAKMFDVTVPTIHSVVHRKTWQHI